MLYSKSSEVALCEKQTMKVFISTLVLHSEFTRAHKRNYNVRIKKNLLLSQIFSVNHLIQCTKLV